MLSNKKLQQIVAELFLKVETKHFSCFYYTKLFCCAKRELQQIAFSHSSDIDFEDI